MQFWKMLIMDWISSILICYFLVAENAQPRLLWSIEMCYFFIAENAQPRLLQVFHHVFHILQDAY